MATRFSFPRDVGLTILGVLLGWGISHYYYLRALDDIKSDAEERKRVEDLILRGIEGVGTIEYFRDGTGKVTGVKIHLRGDAAADSTARGSLR